MKILTPAERLIVAADFKPNYLTTESGRAWARGEVLKLADSLKDTGVCLKVNSVLRACGYGLIDEIHARGLRVFADLKVFDIPETLETDGCLLQEANPELLTVVCSAGIKGMRALKKTLPQTEVLGVTVLTSVDDNEAKTMHGLQNVTSAAQMLAGLADEAEVDGLISSAKEIEFLKLRIKRAMTFNTPAIRPTWAIVLGDDQNPDRIMTPAKAIKAGATRIIVGRPILLAPKPYDAVMKTLEEIALAVS